MSKDMKILLENFRRFAEQEQNMSVPPTEEEEEALMSLPPGGVDDRLYTDPELDAPAQSTSSSATAPKAKAKKKAAAANIPAPPKSEASRCIGGGFPGVFSKGPDAKTLCALDAQQNQLYHGGPRYSAKIGAKRLPGVKDANSAYQRQRVAIGDSDPKKQLELLRKHVDYLKEKYKEANKPGAVLVEPAKRSVRARITGPRSRRALPRPAGGSGSTSSSRVTTSITGKALSATGTTSGLRSAPKQQDPTKKIDFAISRDLDGISIAAVGDSLTAGVPRAPMTYIGFLGGKNFAIGGKATYQLLGQVDRAIQAKPDYLVIWMGTNNPFLGNQFGGCYSYARMYNRMIKDLTVAYKKAKDAGIKVIGITLPNPRVRWQGKYNACRQDPRKKGCCPRLSKDGSQMRDPVRLWQEFQKVNGWIKQNADIAIQLPGAPGSDDGYSSKNDAIRDNIHINSNYQKQIATLIQNEIVKRKSK